MAHHALSGSSFKSRFRSLGFAALLALGVASSGCSDSKETRYQRDIPIFVAPYVHTFETDLGFTIVLDEIEFAAHAIHFTQAGEAHEASRKPLRDLLFPIAHAHPGHNHGGETTGEMQEPAHVRFAIDAPGSPFGYADLAEGQYDAANMVLNHIGSEQSCPITSPADEAPSTLPSIRITGSAEKDRVEHYFVAEIQLERCRTITGIPFDAYVNEYGAVGTIRLLFEGQSRYANLEGIYPTVFDGIEFDRFAGERDVVYGDLLLHSDRPTETMLRARLQSHDYYYFEFTGP